MPLPLPELDDRRFEDLVREAEERLASQLPELTQIAPGDPLHALVDLFAWMTETVIFRANLIPERQRRAFLNLLQLPLRPATPARGIVCIDATAAALPPLLAAESLLKGGNQSFTTMGEVQPTPLELALVVKERLSDAALAQAGVSRAQLRSLYGVEPDPFRPRTLTPGRDPLTLAGTIDSALYLALCAPQRLIKQAEAIRAALPGITLSIGLAPLDDLDSDLAGRPARRTLEWDLAWQQPAAPGAPLAPIEYLPLELVDDSSQGGRRAGVARLRLPRDARFLVNPTVADPRLAGFEGGPPEAPVQIDPARLLSWLRLRCPDEPGLTLGYLGVNAVEVVGQGVVRDLMLGAGNGRPDQSLTLSHRDLDPASLALEVDETGRWVPWTRVEHFTASGPDDRVYRLDPAAGLLVFGDGLRGRRPAANASIRAAAYRYGGGTAGNLAAGGIKELQRGAGFKVRQEWPTSGGIDAETLDQAERRIPAFLTHRGRAVTRDDFAVLARDNPVNPVARAEAVPGFLPGASLGAAHTGVPGVVSVFVLPPATQALAAAPRPTAGLLKDVYRYLEARILVGTELYVLSPQFQPVSCALAVEVSDPTTEVQTFQAVAEAILNYLWSLAPGGPRGEGWPLGRAVEINELRTQAGRVTGVEAVNGVRLFYLDLSAGGWLELTGRQALSLAAYQLPELMAVSVQPGEDGPAPPRGFGPGAGAAPARGVPVPVVPDLC
jgi:hypothetical protein